MTVKTGIGDISLYIPAKKITLSELLEERQKTVPEMTRRLKAAVRSTGQEIIRFPALWEDSVTMGIESVQKLLDKDSAGICKNLRFLATGTESSVDQSKPIAAYMEGALQRGGNPIPTNLSTFQVQHACAGGTIGLISIAALLNIEQGGSQGILTCTDTARYELESSAEITQGAGSVSLLVENDPRLIELDLKTIGYSSRDVDDFFRPNNSVTAKVKGRYSIQCYEEALEEAFLDHTTRLGADPGNYLKDTDIFVLHVPFYQMPVSALSKLINKYTDLEGEELNSFLQEKGFFDSIKPISQIGNIYTASTYLTLAFHLKQSWEKYGDGIAGQKILMASYGSGNTMIVLQGTVSEGAADIISKWDLDSIFEADRSDSWQSYLDWTSEKQKNINLEEALNLSNIQDGAYYLEKIREDGFRVYARK